MCDVKNVTMCIQIISLFILIVTLIKLLLCASILLLKNVSDPSITNAMWIFINICDVMQKFRNCLITLYFELFPS